MKKFCRICKSEGRKSKLYIDNKHKVLGNIQEFYDREGKYHKHTRAYVLIKYHCTNQHEYYEAESKRCPTCGIGWIDG